MRGKKLLKTYPKPSKATICRQTKKPIADKTVDNRKLIMVGKEKLHHMASA